MSKSASRAQSTAKRRRLVAAGRALARAQAGTGQGTKIPRNTSPDRRFIAAAVNLEASSHALIKAMRDHAAFAAKNAYDDQAHGDHQQRVAAASAAHAGSQAEFDLACKALGVER